MLEQTPRGAIDIIECELERIRGVHDVSGIGALARTTSLYSFGQVVLVSIDYTDLTGMKVRPAVVVRDDAFHARRQDAIFAAITGSFSGQPRPGEVDIQDWSQAGLQAPSRLKPVLFTRDFTLVRKRLGRLSATDRDHVRLAIATIFGMSPVPAATSRTPTTPA